jgi:hypothetical protein
MKERKSVRLKVGKHRLEERKRMKDEKASRDTHTQQKMQTPRKGLPVLNTMKNRG